jgi:sulfoxide reductase catalytic subunit YedY
MAKKIRSSEITPEEVYLSRRRFMKGVGALALSSAALAACGGQDPATVVSSAVSPTAKSDGAEESKPEESKSEEPKPEVTQATADELGDSLTSFEAVTNYNNYYEFTTNKERVAQLAEDFVTEPWTVEVGGLVQNPKTYGIEDLRNLIRKNAFIACAALKAGRWLSPGWGSP